MNDRRKVTTSQLGCHRHVGRRAFVAGCLATIGAAAVPSMFPTPAIAKNTLDVRNLYMTHQRTGETINFNYWVEGSYIPDVLSEINFFMRDWRDNKVCAMDTRNIDTLAAIHQALDTNQPFELLSGYRTQSTNTMLRRQGRQVAKRSLHLQGMAADIRVKGVSTELLAKAAQRCRSGGVGRYFRSGFVHVDCGQVRTWRG